MNLLSLIAPWHPAAELGEETASHSQEERDQQQQREQEQEEQQRRRERQRNLACSVAQAIKMGAETEVYSEKYGKWLPGHVSDHSGICEEHKAYEQGCKACRVSLPCRGASPDRLTLLRAFRKRGTKSSMWSMPEGRSVSTSGTKQVSGSRLHGSRERVGRCPRRKTIWSRRSDRVAAKTAAAGHAIRVLGVVSARRESLSGAVLATCKDAALLGILTSHPSGLRPSATTPH